MSTDNPPESRTDDGIVAHGEPLVEVSGLKKHFDDGLSLLDRLLGAEQQAVKAVDGVDFTIDKGETLGLVGESGCGKSTVGETTLQLQTPTDGSVTFDGTDITEQGDLTEFRSRAQIVFQDPYSSLDPRMPVGRSIRQPLDIHDWPQGASDKMARRRDRVAELMERVGLSADQLDRYPGEFSGGQLQRVGIARALALDPDFIVLDEPTSALDVSVQAQILNLLSELQEEFDLTYLFISHDLGVIRYICDRIAVMYLGEIVEIAPAEELFTNPQHPYTKALLESVPRVELAERDRDIDPLSGDVPSPRNPPSGCRFRTRCPEIIPPEDLDISQDGFRAVMDVRDRIERREVAAEKVRDLVSEELAEDDPDTSRLDSLVTDRLYERLVPVDLPGPVEEDLREALELVVDEGWEAAETMLREEYQSVCETDHPTGQVACHLVEE